MPRASVENREPVNDRGTPLDPQGETPRSVARMWGSVVGWRPMTDPTICFRTPRLVIRRIDERDYDAMYAVYSDAEAMRYVDDGEPISPDECRRWIEVTQDNYSKRGYGMSAVELEGGPVIGFMGLVHPGGQEVAELKYALARAHWGKGYATEAAKGFLAHGQAQFGIERVIATTAPENTPSHRVLLKCGMVDTGTRVDQSGDETQVFEWAKGAPPGGFEDPE